MNSNIEILYFNPALLAPWKNNANTHNRKQRRALRRLIERNGFLQPILIDSNRRIICGHLRHSIAVELGLETVPTICISHLSEAELRAQIIADNQIARMAGWDRGLLALEFEEMKQLCPELELSITGFDSDEIDRILDVPSPTGAAAEVRYVPATGGDTPVTEFGDLWLIGGKHRLLCGDALQATSYQALLGSEQADLVVSDPPYNVRVNGHIRKSGSADGREFVQASGELNRAEFRRFLSDAAANLSRFSRSGSLHYVFMDWRSIADLIQAGEEVYDGLLNIIVWDKQVGGLGSLYRSQHELIALFKKGEHAHINNVQLGSKGRNRTNVWAYPGANADRKARKVEAGAHPTPKNLTMIVDAIKDASDPGDLVLDPFGGSGTTLFAAHRCNRVGRLMELDPLYCDLILRTAEREGLEACLNDTQESFEAVRSRRSQQPSGQAPE